MIATTAMILCAGRGERMRPLTDISPKPLLTVQGIPLLGWHLQRLKQAGFTRVVINHCWLGQQIVDYAKQFSSELEVLFSPEPVALETAGGIAKALPLLGKEPFVVVNGDIFTDFDFAKLTQLSTNCLGELVLVNNPQHNPNGDFALYGNQVMSEGESKLTFSGIALYSPDLFIGVDATLVSPLAPLLRHAMEKQLISGQHFQGQWCDVGTPERLAQLNHQEEKA